MEKAILQYNTAKIASYTIELPSYFLIIHRYLNLLPLSSDLY